MVSPRLRPYVDPKLKGWRPCATVAEEAAIVPLRHVGQIDGKRYEFPRALSPACASAVTVQLIKTTDPLQPAR